MPLCYNHKLINVLP